LRGLARNLILQEKIKTTQAKAKAVRPVVEKLITAGKKNDLTARRRINAFLDDRKATDKILKELSPRYQERPGGYLRISKLEPRAGDGADMAVIEFV